MASITQHKTQMFKFGMYGFLKNLRFFEPYIIIFFLASELNLFKVGILISIREIIKYVFEIPSGVIADQHGKKSELAMCFVFYIISFVLFFIGGIQQSFLIFIVAMIFYGFGEAFRSGTHKSMIMQFLDKEDIEESKSMVYGQTRSMSLIGSMVMSIVSIVFVLWLPDIRYLFLIAIIPFAIDLLMILTYPKYMNQKQQSSFKLKTFLKENWLSIKYVVKTKKVRGFVFDASAFQAGFKSIKDYIQPLIISISIGLVVIDRFTIEENQKIYIGVIYAIIYFISSFATRNAHKVEAKYDKVKVINYAWLIMGLVSLIIGLFTNNIIVIFLAFVLMYITLNIRRPVMVQEIGNVTDEGKRASVLSIQSQISSLLLVIFAPIIGLIADYSLKLLFILVGATMILIFIIATITRRQIAANKTG